MDKMDLRVKEDDTRSTFTFKAKKEEPMALATKEDIKMIQDSIADVKAQISWLIKALGPPKTPVQPRQTVADSKKASI